MLVACLLCLNCLKLKRCVAVCGRLSGATIVRVVDPKCAYRPVACDPNLRSIAARLRGQVITGISRIGKRVLIETDRWALVLQPKMDGLVSIEDPPSLEHVRLILELDNCATSRVLFWDRRGLGTIQLLHGLKWNRGWSPVAWAPMRWSSVAKSSAIDCKRHRDHQSGLARSETVGWCG